jgi:hypothetical protein
MKDYLKMEKAMRIAGTPKLISPGDETDGNCTDGFCAIPVLANRGPSLILPNKDTDLNISNKKIYSSILPTQGDNQTS